MYACASRGRTNADNNKAKHTKRTLEFLITSGFKKLHMVSKSYRSSESYNNSTEPVDNIQTSFHFLTYLVGYLS